MYTNKNVHKNPKTYLQVGAEQRIVTQWAVGPAAEKGTPAPLWLKSASPPSEWYYKRTWRETVCQTECVKTLLFKKEKVELGSSLLKRVDLKYKIVTADVFLQTSLQSPQHLHLEHYTQTHQRTRVRKEDVYSITLFSLLHPSTEAAESTMSRTDKLNIDYICVFQAFLRLHH